MLIDSWKPTTQEFEISTLIQFLKFPPPFQHKNIIAGVYNFQTKILEKGDNLLELIAKYYWNKT